MSENVERGSDIDVPAVDKVDDDIDVDDHDGEDDVIYGGRTEDFDWVTDASSSAS